MTPVNYKELQELHLKYHQLGLTILGFPCNQFGSQEPGSAEEIQLFTKNKNVTFQIMKKIKVNGPNAEPVFIYLKSMLKKQSSFGSFIKWNFTKFLCDRNGIPVKRYSPTTNPMAMEKDILSLLE